jgi:hypothetical protein
MKLFIHYLYVLLLVLMLPALQINAQQKNSGTEESIASIRTEFKRINALALTTEEFQYDSAGCVDGGVVTYFLENQEIVKIVESGAIGDGSWIREFYYQSGKFIFCYEEIVGGPAEGPETKTAFRTYVKDDKVIRFMEDKKIVPANNKATGQVSTASSLLKAYRTKDFAKVLCE